MLFPIRIDFQQYVCCMALAMVLGEAAASVTPSQLSVVFMTVVPVADTAGWAADVLPIAVA